MRTIVVSFAFLFMSCGHPAKETASDSDSTTWETPDAHDSIGTTAPDWGFGIDYYLASEPLDTLDFQLIDKTCAVLIEETPAQEAARIVAEETEEKARVEREEKERQEWESQPHDSGDYFVSESDGSGYQGDGDFYQMQARDLLKELEIPTVTARSKQYVKLVGSNNKEWAVDVRTNMQPNWTMILFQVNREPVVIEAMDVTKERLKEFFYRQ